MSATSHLQETVHFHNSYPPGSYLISGLFVVSSLCQMTPLHVAAERGHTKIVEYLVNKGADINIQDKNGVIMHDYFKDSVVLLI